MVDLNIRALDCDDCEGERGKRGHRGHRGHDGRDGDTGPTGPTGPMGFTGSTGPGFDGSAGPTRLIFTVDGVYVPTPGTTRVRVLMSGGGGGGGGSSGSPTGNSVGGGGAAGADLDFIVDGPITGGSVLIGTGGPGGFSNPGSNGLLTSVTINAVVYTASPGEGGGRTQVTGSNAVAFGGITLPGSSAVDIVSGDDGMSGVHGGLAAAGGNGGSGEFGIGGQGFRALASAGDGLPGTGFGSGGGGAASTTTDQTGGNGAPGVVIIEEFM